MSPKQTLQPPGRAEFDAATGSVRFTKDFNPALEAIMRDTMATNGQRMLAWVKRRAWGNFSLYCVRDDGTPALQADCARELGIEKGNLSRTFSYYQTQGYVRFEGRLIFPVISPVPPDKSCTTYTTFENFIRDWKVANAATFEAWEQAETNAKSYRKVVLNAFKQWRRSATNGPASLYESSEELKESGHNQNGSSSSGLSLVPQPEQTTTAGPAETNVSTPPAPADPLPRKLLVALRDRTRNNTFSKSKAESLIAAARRVATDRGEAISDDELEGCIDTAWESARRKVGTIGFYDTALPEKVEAFLEARERDRDAAAEHQALSDDDLERLIAETDRKLADFAGG